MDLSDAALQHATAAKAAATALLPLIADIETVEPTPQQGEVALSDRFADACQRLDAAASDLLSMAPEIDAAEYVAPPPPPPPPTGWLDTATAGMTAGQLRLLNPDFSWFRTPNNAYWTVDWTPRMHWDAAREQVVKFGLRLDHRAVAYNGAWRNLPLPAAYSPPHTFTGHWYGWCAYDGADTVLAKDFLFDLQTETYTPIAPIPVINNGANGTMCAWLASSGRFVRYGGDGRRWMEYDPSSNSWPVVVNNLPHGQHALLEYNGVDDRCLMVGGNSTETVVSLVATGGVVTPLPPIPQIVQMKNGAWIVALPEGGWIVRTTPAADPRMWKISAANPVWQDVGPWPKIGIGAHTVAMVADRRLLLVGTSTGLHAYKL